MKRLILLLGSALLVISTLDMAGGCSSCGFSFLAIINGPSLSKGTSYWDCSDNVVELPDYIAFFIDGSGVSSSLGAFTWKETGCGIADLTTDLGEFMATDFQGSRDSGTMSFQIQEPLLGIVIRTNCTLINAKFEDPDGDSRPSDRDNCPDVANADQQDTDGDDIGDVCDNDDDNDLIEDDADNCPLIYNTDQSDSEGDGVGDLCDDDDDNDGTPDVSDPCPLDPADACVS